MPRESIALGLLWLCLSWCDVELSRVMPFGIPVWMQSQKGSWPSIPFLTGFIWKWSKVRLHMQTLGLDCRYSFTLLDWLCACTMCSLRSDSMSSEPLFCIYLLFTVIPSSLDLPEKISLLKESYWRVLLPSDLEMFLLLLFSFGNVVSEAL